MHIKNIKSSLLTLGLVLLGSVVSSITIPNSMQASETLNLTDQYGQTIKGWGFFSYTRRTTWYDEKWNVTYSSGGVDALYSDLNASILRYDLVPECYDAGESDTLDHYVIDELKDSIIEAKGKGISDYFLAVWSPPASMKYPASTEGWAHVHKVTGELGINKWDDPDYEQVATTLKTESEDAFIQYIVNSLIYLRDNGAGLPKAFSVQNEPGWVTTYESCDYEWEQYHRMVKNVKAAFIANGLDEVDVVFGDCNGASWLLWSSNLNLGYNFSKLDSDADLLNSVDAIASHTYDNWDDNLENRLNQQEMAASAMWKQKEKYGMEFYMSEWIPDRASDTADLTGIQYTIYEMEHALRDLRVYPFEYFIWYSGWGVRDYTEKSDLFAYNVGSASGQLHKSKLYHIFQRLWGEVPHDGGYRTRYLTSSDADIKTGKDNVTINALAFDGNGKTVVVLINPTATEKTFTFSGLDNFSTAELLRTTSNEDMVSHGMVSITNGITNLTLPAESINFLIGGGEPTEPAAPVITVAPQDTGVIEGGSVTFSVIATGNPIPSYQWQKNGVDIADATDSTYEIVSATLDDSGTQYQVIVSNEMGTVTSSQVNLRVTANTVIASYDFEEDAGSSDPGNEIVNYGTGGTTFNLTNTGGPDGRDNTGDGGYGAEGAPGAGNAFDILASGNGTPTDYSSRATGGGLLISGNVSQSQLQGESGAFTYEALIQINTTDGSQSILSHDGWNSARGFDFAVSAGSLKLYPGAGDMDSVLATIPTTGEHAFESNEWFHVAVSYNGNEGEADNVKLYWTRVGADDGVANEIGTGTFSSDLQGDISNPLGVGTYSRSAFRNELNGLIDEVNMHSVALSASEFEVTPTTSEELVSIAYYDFEEEAGDTDPGNSILNYGTGGTSLNMTNTGGPDGRDNTGEGGYGATGYTGAGTAFDILASGDGTIHDWENRSVGGGLATSSGVLQSTLQGADGAFTYEALIQVASTSGAQVILSHDGWNSDRGFSFRILNGQLSLSPGGGMTEASASIPTTGAHAFVANEWYHVAVSYNGDEGATDNVNLYWTRVGADDGVANLIGTGTFTADLIGTTSNQLGIGTTTRSTFRNELNGLIDEVRLTGFVRTASELVFGEETSTIQAVEEVPAIAYYQFEEDAGVSDPGNSIVNAGTGGTSLDMTNTGGFDGRDNTGEGGYGAAGYSGAGDAFNILASGNGTLHTWDDRSVGGGLVTSGNVSQSALQGESGAFTYEALIQIEMTSSGVQTILSHDGWDTRGFDFAIVGDSLKLYPRTGDMDDVVALIPTTGTHAFVANEWFHVAVSYSGVEGEVDNVKLYWTRVGSENGAANQIGTGTFSEDLQTSSNPLGLGTTSRSAFRNELNGSIDEVRLTGAELSAEQLVFVPQLTEQVLSVEDEVEMISYVSVSVASSVVSTSSESDLDGEIDTDLDGLPDAWEIANGLDPSASNSDTDTSGDGVSDLMKYALDLDPQVTDFTETTQIEAEGGFLTLSANRNPDAIHLVFDVEVSGDLIQWDSGPEHVTVLLDSPSFLKVRDNIELDEGSSRYIRLKVSVAE
jgi:O-glycosyl hydrolase